MSLHAVFEVLGCEQIGAWRSLVAQLLWEQRNGFQSSLKCPIQTIPKRLHFQARYVLWTPLWTPNGFQKYDAVCARSMLQGVAL